jgi:hypothetical protein
LEPRLRSDHGDAPWIVAVKSAATALECLRQRWAESRRSLARELLVRGIPFSTFTDVEPRTTSMRSSLSCRHAPREAGYKPDQHDYRQYEAELKTFLLKEGKARAAFLRGGLLWRLAREVLGTELDEQVLLGPSAGGNTHVNRVKLTPRGTPLWDDSLSDAEVDFICGVIPILTGKLEHRTLRQ